MLHGSRTFDFIFFSEKQIKLYPALASDFLLSIDPSLVVSFWVMSLDALPVPQLWA